MLTKVLVVDDDTQLTELLKIVLVSESFEVHAANSGPEGIRLTKDVCPDVVILDLFMPGMDGLQVCYEIRKFSTVPILILTAINKPGLVARALDAGADDFLLKPTPHNELIAHLRKLARRARAEQEASNSKLTYFL